MISIFPLWTFHLYVTTFQYRLHMEYISLSWYDIPELVVPIRMSLIEDFCYQGSFWTKGSYWLSWSYHFESFTVTTFGIYTLFFLWLIHLSEKKNGTNQDERDFRETSRIRYNKNHKSKHNDVKQSKMKHTKSLKNSQ